MVDLVAGGFVAGVGGETGHVAEGIVGGKHAGGLAGRGGDGLVPHTVFELPEAALTPASGDHVVDAVAFEWGTGLKERDVLVEEGVEIGAGFVVEEDEAGLAAATTVAKGVA